MGAARAHSSFGFSFPDGFPDGFPQQISWELAGLGLNFPEGHAWGTWWHFNQGKGSWERQDTVLDFCTRAVTIPEAFHTLWIIPQHSLRNAGNSIHQLGRTNVTLLYFSIFPLEISIPVSFLLLSMFTSFPMCSFSCCILLEHELWAIFSEDKAAVVGPLVFSLSFSVPF